MYYGKARHYTAADFDDAWEVVAMIPDWLQEKAESWTCDCCNKINFLFTDLSNPEADFVDDFFAERRGSLEVPHLVSCFV